MKSILIFILTMSVASQVLASTASFTFAMKDGKILQTKYHHLNAGLGALWEKSSLLNVETRRHGDSPTTEYTIESRDGSLGMVDSIGYSSSILSVDLREVTSVARYGSGLQLWELTGPSVDLLYDVLAELDTVDEQNAITRIGDKEPSFSFDNKAVICHIDRGGFGQPSRPPVKKCYFADR